MISNGDTASPYLTGCLDKVARHSIDVWFECDSPLGASKLVGRLFVSVRLSRQPYLLGRLYNRRDIRHNSAGYMWVSAERPWA